ncbi:unnamed protein product, partial [Effrenium voratum]
MMDPMVQPAWTRWPLALTRHQRAVLGMLAVPVVLIHCLDFLAQISHSHPGPASARDLLNFDMFSGASKVICNSFRSLGMRSQHFDVLNHPEDNILETSGFLKLLQGVLRTKEDGHISCGIPCNSFVFLNSHTSGRTRSNPLGREDERDYVLTANRIVARASLALCVALARSVFFQVEQPSSTKLFFMPYMEHIRGICDDLGVNFSEVFMWLGLFGHFCPKPTRLWGTSPWARQFAARLTKLKRQQLKLSSEG